MVASDSLPPLDPDATALLVVDVQVAFCSPESPLADRGVDISAAVERVADVRDLLEGARERELTVAFTRSVRRSDAKDAPRRVYDILPDVYGDGSPICCAGAPDAEFVEGIEPEADEYAVEKRRYDGFFETSLDSYLRNEGIDTVVLCGFTTNVCVESTARGAHERGYDVIVAGNCCASFSESAHEHSLQNVEMILGTVADREAILAALDE